MKKESLNNDKPFLEKNKKTRQQQANDLLFLTANSPEINNIKHFFGIPPEKEILVHEAMFLGCMRRATQKGDVNAFKKLLKLAEVNENSKANEQSEKLCDIISQLKESAPSK